MMDEASGTTGRAGGGRRIPRPILMGIGLLPVALLAFSCSGCSPVYLAKAGWAEFKILKGRRPFDEVLADPETDEETRRKLLLARQARSFAIHQLKLDAGDSYTSFTQLDTDTLAWVLSAAHRDRLESKTWWFPIVGRVPYKGYASQGSAENARLDLEREGFDTYLRTTSAFSTLGWFADPLLSSLLRYDDVDLVETILHELSHNHLFVPGRVRFNESFATFVGRVGAIRFFCGPPGTPQNPPECRLARDRWADYQAFSRFLDQFIGDLQVVYRDPELTVNQKIRAREELFKEYQDRYLGAQKAVRELGSVPETTGEWASSQETARESETPQERSSPLVVSFLNRPLNNAILLARMRYFHRLPDFQALLDRFGGELSATIDVLKEGAESVDDPFQLLPGPNGT